MSLPKTFLVFFIQLYIIYLLKIYGTAIVFGFKAPVLILISDLFFVKSEVFLCFSGCIVRVVARVAAER